MPEFLPISRADMQRRGWEQCDFVYIIGDGYVDHPSFGHAIISRVLEDAGYKVGIISQPDWKNPASINALGEPRLGFLHRNPRSDRPLPASRRGPQCAASPRCRGRRG